MPLGGLSVFHKKSSSSSRRSSPKDKTGGGIDKTLRKGRRKSASSVPWGLRRGGYRRADSCSSSEEETASLEEEACDSRDEDFFQRFHVTVVKAVSDQKQQQATEEVCQQAKEIRTEEQKQVRFHKYDHVMYLGGYSEYHYSLYDREVEEESTRAITEDIEGVVGDVSYFFKCIQKGIHDAASGNSSDEEGSGSIVSDSVSGSISESASISSV